MARKKNNSDLLLWCMGWIARQYQGDESNASVGRKISMSGAGYARMAEGTSGNFRTWCDLFNVYDKDIVSVLAASRVIARDIEDRTAELGRELDDQEKEALAHDIAKILNI